jgi:hypothetical protein
MIECVAARDNYLLLREGERYAVVERRAGKLYSLRDGRREPVEEGDEAALRRLIGEDGWSDEATARRVQQHLAERHDELAQRIW